MDDGLGEMTEVRSAYDAETIAEQALTGSNDTINVEVLKLLLSRLAQILAQEADMLDSMEIQKMGGLQKEKKALVDALEKQKKLIARRGTLLAELTEDEEYELRELVEVFEAIAQENYKRLLVAKEVNARVVQAIAELANEQAQQQYYTKLGARAGDPSVSLSLNRSI
jgi:predicted Zn-ribbon and HTH transcriptional regulator